LILLATISRRIAVYCFASGGAQLGVCRRLAAAIPDRRDPESVRHAMFERVMASPSAIACGYEDAVDLDRLRHNPLMKVAARCPASGAPLASQSTISRLENAPSKTVGTRLSAALLDQFGTSVKPGKLWARERAASIVEDDYASEFRYGGRPLASLQPPQNAGDVSQPVRRAGRCTQAPPPISCLHPKRG
jgi:hypothetical protein